MTFLLVPLLWTGCAGDNTTTDSATAPSTDSGETTGTADSGTTAGTDSGTTDSGTTAGTDSGTTDSGTTDTEPPPERWEAWSLRNDLVDCFIDNPVYPSRAEFGQLAGVRLVPPDAPFRVETIDYVLATAEADEACEDSLAHRIEVWSQPDGLPDASPTLHETLDVPASVAFGAGASREFSQTLATPLDLAEGQVLFVGLELPGGPSGAGCVMTCASTTAEGSNFWSNAVVAPYDWVELITFDLPGNYKIRAGGQAETSGLERTCDDGDDEDSDGLTDCDDPDCTLEPVCAICTDGDLGSAIGPAVATGTTVDVQGDHLLSCAFEDAAGDVGWSWTAPSSGLWRFEVTSPEGTLALALFDECGGTELGCNYKTFEEAAVEQVVTEGDAVVIVVKAAIFPWAGEYTLDITAVE
jgi:hypothetical protein